MLNDIIKYGFSSKYEICESRFNFKNNRKMETLFAQGNGYLGIRGSHEERYANAINGVYIAGTYNKSSDIDITEIPNISDFLSIEMLLNDERFTLEAGEIKKYCRKLDLKNGLLERKITWLSPKGFMYEITFRRFVALHNLNLVMQEVELKPLNSEVYLEMESGISAATSNSGDTHTIELEKRIFEEDILQQSTRTKESQISISTAVIHSFEIDNYPVKITKTIDMPRRKILYKYTQSLHQNEILRMTKWIVIHTSRDRNLQNINSKSIMEHNLFELKEVRKITFDKHLELSSKVWDTEVWDNSSVEIKSTNELDQIAVNFSQYHLRCMTPYHDNRMSIGAKGLTGEGYRGHVFWDTEIFILPYYTHTNPTVARSLLEYRYLSLKGAREKAIEYNCEGAQFPWESAWITDGEVTPLLGSVNVKSGIRNKILTGTNELHITADVAYGIWYYFQNTQDDDFMEKYGYEIIFETAQYWASRAKYVELEDNYQICDVIGPDEYTEHANNNTYTNYLAQWNIGLAISYYKLLKKRNPVVYNNLKAILNLDKYYEMWIEVVEKIKVHKPNENLIIPQDDSFLSLTDIDMSKYKNKTELKLIFKDYTLSEVNKLQVIKQADIVALLYLFGDDFTNDVKEASFNYYEARTVHDSSLSMGLHSIVANQLGYNDLSYELFHKSCLIDLNENMNLSHDGIHAASLGGIWQSVIMGYGGLRVSSNKIQISPQLPKLWEELRFSIIWRNEKLDIFISQHSIKITNTSNSNNEVQIDIFGKEYTIRGEIILPYKMESDRI